MSETRLRLSLPKKRRNLNVHIFGFTLRVFLLFTYRYQRQKKWRPRQQSQEERRHGSSLNHQVTAPRKLISLLKEREEEKRSRCRKKSLGSTVFSSLILARRSRKATRSGASWSRLLKTRYYCDTFLWCLYT